MSTPPITQRLGASWEKVDGWPYHVSDEGQVWSEHTEKVLRPYSNESGRYMVVDLRDAGKRKQRYVHGLVLEAHQGRPEGMEANHRNGDTKDNRLENLEWIEPDEHDEVTQQQQEGGALGPDDAAPF